MERGWIKIYRKLQDNPLWQEKPFSRGQAWVDLILIANHKDGCVRKRGVKIEVKRGQAGWSIKGLADRWGWSQGKAKRFIKELKNDEQIEEQNNSLTTLITIINYEDYQVNGEQNRERTENKRGTNGEQTETNKNVKKEKKVKNDKNKDIYGEFKNIFLTKDEYQKLSAKYPGHHTDMIERMSQHIETKPKDPYKSHYAAILKNEDWLKKKTTTTGFKSRTEKNTEAKEEFLRNNNIQEKDITPDIKTLEAE